MRKYPKPLNKLINELSRLPGIGGKTAQRLAFHILSMSDGDAFRLSDSIREAKEQMRYCSVCGNLTDVDPCAICSDTDRDPSVICVVESPRDVIAMEKIREFKGYYHVLQQFYPCRKDTRIRIFLYHHFRHHNRNDSLSFHISV